MRVSKLAFVVAVGAASIQSPALAQDQHGHLHINTRWRECSFQIDPALTQTAWRQFTEEAGLVVYFRPLSGAKPMGRGKFEVSVLQWDTAIEDADAAWNDTFVHPDSVHWLFEGEGLKFPGLMVRAGIGDKTDAGLYLTKAVGANYGFVGGQLQRNLVNSAAKNTAVSTRVSFVSIYGPEDLEFTVYGMDLLASKTYPVSRRVSVSPYALVSASLSNSHETTTAVNLADENVLGAQASVGAVAEVSKARIGVEYNFARVRSISLKVGVGGSR